MEVQSSDHFKMQLQERKFSQNTCISSRDNSPNSEERRHEDYGRETSLKAFSPTTPSFQTQQSPQKMFLTLSIRTLSSLQNQTHTSSMIISQQLQHPIIYNHSQLSMEEETAVQSGTKISSTNNIQHSNSEMKDSGLIEANIKNKLAPQNHNLNFTANLQSGYNFHNTNKTIANHQDNSQQLAKCTTDTSPVVQKRIRPLPSYIEARPALYTWIRNLCRQMDMCFDVFALTMKYLDEYHFTYGHAYDRSTFTIKAYGMIILASKLMNKQILTPKVIAQKIMVSQQQLESLEMSLIQMMNFKMYFETHVKELQRKLEKWEEICQSLSLKEQLSFFADNLFSFKRFYCLIREVQKFAKVNLDVTEPMLLTAFIKSLSSQFKKDYRAQRLLAQILSLVFDSLISANPTEYSFENILRSINHQMEAENKEETQTWAQVRKCYQQRENNQIFCNYNVFLNSILDISI